MRTVEATRASGHLKFSSVMAYEALLSQCFSSNVLISAGAPDRRPNDLLMNFVLPILKKLSWPHVVQRRKEISDYANKFNIEFFNGGGTATILKTVCTCLKFSDTQRDDSACTEIAVGSGFLQSQVFDYHQTRVNTNCAFLFGLRVTRVPDPGIITCQSGGFIARY
jgi:hypothetical protein